MKNNKIIKSIWLDEESLKFLKKIKEKKEKNIGNTIKEKITIFEIQEKFRLSKYKLEELSGISPQFQRYRLNNLSILKAQSDIYRINCIGQGVKSEYI